MKQYRYKNGTFSKARIAEEMKLMIWGRVAMLLRWRSSTKSSATSSAIFVFLSLYAWLLFLHTIFANCNCSQKKQSAFDGLHGYLYLG